MQYYFEDFFTDLHVQLLLSGLNQQLGVFLATASIFQQDATSDFMCMPSKPEQFLLTLMEFHYVLVFVEDCMHNFL